MTASGYLAVFITASSTAEADTIAGALVDEGLAACVNIVPACRSVYKWKGEVVRDDEVLLMVKTSRRHFERLERRVTELHSYDVPEVIGVELQSVAGGYAGFLRDSLGDAD